MKDLNYDNIKEMLDGERVAAGTNGDGELLILQAEHLGDELVYTAMWETKRNERVAWFVKHWYHEDGTVEETFERELVA